MIPPAAAAEGGTQGPAHQGLRASAAVAAVALAARLAVVAWAAPRIVPIDDAALYLPIAERMARGLGYTWVWADGSVTTSAFYPVGYPAMVAAVYTLTGPHLAAAMVLNAALGTLGAVAAHRLALRAAGSAHGRLAFAAGLLVALHPALVAYTPVAMTDGVIAALVTCAAAVAAWARDRAAVRPVVAGAAVGLVLGVATLVRPQSIVLAPIFGLIAAGGGRGWGRRAGTLAVSATLAALLVCAPWTARNCLRMKRCALVSYNGGWNLLVSTGEPFRVPDACRDVFDEAEKDACFGREARRIIVAHPAAWIALAPGKLAGTFDYAGAAPWYLHASNPTAFPRPAKLALGIAETLVERLALLGALAWAALGALPPGPRDGRLFRGARGARVARVAVALLGALFAITLHAWIGYAAFALAALLRGRSLWTGPVLGGTAVVVLLATMATHAAFFGLGRYSMVVFPLLTALAPMALARVREREREDAARRR